MQEVKSIKNQYRGISAHLNSLWQQPGGGWKGFHTGHITYLAMSMRAGLRLMGYVARIEDSLQIRLGAERVGSPESDVLIYDQDPYRPYMPDRTTTQSAGTAVLSITAAMDRFAIDAKPYQSLAIYPPGRAGRGKAVAWVELLSPSNKPGGRHFDVYWNKREHLLKNGLVVVEIDYLHQSPPTLAGVMNYRSGASDAYPYRIAVADPRPTLEEGRVYVYEFGVDMPLPTVDIPLNAGDVFQFDFDALYQKMFVEMFYGDEVDYSLLPSNFETYSEADRLRILARMLAVIEAAERGEDLEQADIAPVEGLSLGDALERLGTLQA